MLPGLIYNFTEVFYRYNVFANYRFFCLFI